MKRKFLLVFFTLLALLFVNTFSYATNSLKTDFQEMTNSIINNTENLGNNVKNGIENTGNTIEDGARDFGNMLSNEMQDMGNTINSDMDNMTGTTNSSYTATRTESTMSDTDITNSSMWTWIAIAVAGAVIVGLVWYYATEHNVDR